MVGEFQSEFSKLQLLTTDLFTSLDILQSLHDELAIVLMTLVNAVVFEEGTVDTVQSKLQQLKDLILELRRKSNTLLDCTKNVIQIFLEFNDPWNYSASDNTCNFQPKDVINICFETFTRFFNFMPKFQEQNRKIYELGLSDGLTFETNKKLVKNIFDEFVPTFLRDVVFKFTFITKQPPYIILRSENEVFAGQNQNTKSNSSIHNKSFDLQLKLFAVNKIKDFILQNKGKFNLRPIITASVTKWNDYVNNLSFDEVATLSESKFFLNKQNDFWIGDFNNLRIKRVLKNKFDKQKVEETMLCIVFDIYMGKITLPDWNGCIELQHQIVSLPFALITFPDPAKENNLLANVSWNRSFNKECLLTDFKLDTTSYSWSTYRKHLSDLFINVTGCRALESSNIFHLGELLFDSNIFNDNDAHRLKFDEYLETYCNASCKFWDWFITAMEIVQNKNIKPYWNENFISGFLSRANAEKLLSDQSEPTMLIRFSDTVKAGLVFSVIFPQTNESVMHIFLDHNYFYRFTLAQCLLKLYKSDAKLKKVKYIITGPDQIELVESFLHLDVDEDKRIKEKSKTIDFRLSTHNDGPKLRRNFSDKTSFLLKFYSSCTNNDIGDIRGNNERSWECTVVPLDAESVETIEDNETSSVRNNRSSSDYSSEYTELINDEESRIPDFAPMQNVSAQPLENFVELSNQLSPMKLKEEPRYVEEFFYNREKCSLQRE